MRMETKLVVPVYLNQRMVFDLLAMIQGGISTVTAVTTRNDEVTSAERQIGTSFGLSNALSSLLKIDLSAERNTKNQNSHGDTSAEERVHTPASLLFRLRNTLLENDQLKLIDNNTSIAPGDFVEFEATLHKNPIVEAMDGLNQLMSMALLFEDKPTQPQNNKGGKNLPQKSDNQKVKEQIEAFAGALKTGSTIDLTTSIFGADLEAVVTVEIAYLNDPLMSDLVDGRFRVIGKVIRSVSDASESISLIRNTPLSKLPTHMLGNFSGLLEALGTVHNFVVPEIRWEVPGPALQVLPIAIYA